MPTPTDVLRDPQVQQPFAGRHVTDGLFEQLADMVDLDAAMAHLVDRRPGAPGGPA